ncbi:MAG: hypothetical protein ACYDEN_07420 [Acidimicrobiales bacterium]
MNENVATSTPPEVSVRQSKVSEAARAVLDPSVEVVRQRAESRGDVTVEDGAMHMKRSPANSVRVVSS